ncbi:MAG: hypothetical protein KAW02_04930 [candidate division Zixibacteria bacterium]|nr:hypothetical protein [candidate division Zixibacteria bacterium]
MGSKDPAKDVAGHSNIRYFADLVKLSLDFLHTMMGQRFKHCPNQSDFRIWLTIIFDLSSSPCYA